MTSLEYEVAGSRSVTIWVCEAYVKTASVGAAAVADQRPETCSAEKVKKQDGSETLTLVRTPDVLATLEQVGWCWAGAGLARKQ